MKTVMLSQGKVALVDDADYARVAAYKWCASKHRSTFYAQSCINGHVTSMHRFILGVQSASVHVDHESYNGLDNRRKNIRRVTPAFNQHQTRKRRGRFGRCTTSRYKGVSFEPERNKWRSQVCINNKAIYIGRFNTEVAAARAYDRKLREAFGIRRAGIGGVCNFSLAVVFD